MDCFCVEWDQDAFDVDEWWAHHPEFIQNRGYHPIAAYHLDLLMEERRQAGSNILLLTDDADAIDEAQAFHPDNNWHWFKRSRYRGKPPKGMKHVVAEAPMDDVIASLGPLRLRSDAMPLCAG
jgi:hypothetical protein